MALPLVGQVNRHVAWFSCLYGQVLAKCMSCYLCAFFFFFFFCSDLLMSKFAFIDSSSYILELGSPLGSRLKLDIYYVATSLVSRSPHIWAAFSRIAAHGALVCHHFIETDCVLTDNSMNKACIVITF